jgi:hypothetical protein
MTDKTTTGRTMKTPRWDSLQEVFVPSLANWRIWALQFFLGILIALGVVGFLRTGETWGQLILGCLLIVMAAVVWLTLQACAAARHSGGDLLSSPHPG